MCLFTSRHDADVETSEMISLRRIDGCSSFEAPGFSSKGKLKETVVRARCAVLGAVGGGQ